MRRPNCSVWTFCSSLSSMSNLVIMQVVSSSSSNFGLWSVFIISSRSKALTLNRSPISLKTSSSCRPSIFIQVILPGSINLYASSTELHSFSITVSFSIIIALMWTFSSFCSPMNISDPATVPLDVIRCLMDGFIMCCFYPCFP